MAWEVGWSGKVEIVRNSVETINDKDAVKLYVRNTDGDTGGIVIYMTPKSMNMARAQLKIAGFDPDKRSLADLVRDESALAGNWVPIYVDEYNGKVQLRIETRRVPPPATLAKYDSLLKKKSEPTAGVDSETPLFDESDIPF